jgi:hypothetical protein
VETHPCWQAGFDWPHQISDLVPSAGLLRLWPPAARFVREAGPVNGSISMQEGTEGRAVTGCKLATLNITRSATDDGLIVRPNPTRAEFPQNQHR